MEQDVSEITGICYQVIDDLVDQYMPKSYADQWDMEGLYAATIQHLGLDVPYCLGR